MRCRFNAAAKYDTLRTMRILFLHQNFPAQFVHVAQALERQSGHELVALTDTVNKRPEIIATKRYDFDAAAFKGVPPLAQNYAVRAMRGEVAARAMVRLRESGFDPADPKWMVKVYFLMLQRDEWLAGLQTHFEDASNVLTISQNGSIAAQGDLETAEGRGAIERFFATRFAGAIKGPPKILSSNGHSFSDIARKVVSIINLGSIAAIEKIVGQPVHPLRFRANLYVSGWPAWHEFELLDQTLAIGEARLKVVKRIVRCAAINVDPETAERDLNIPPALMRHLGHNECGIYAEVVADGTIATGDAITISSSA